MKVTLDQLRQRYSWSQQRRMHYEWKSEQPPERLKRHEVWRHAYLAHPYLIGSSTARVEERMCHVFKNAMEIGPTGLLQPVPLNETDEFMQLFTHLLVEYEHRGGVPTDLIRRAREPVVRYFEHGTPVGFTMFEGYKRPTRPILVKYGKREFLEPMLRTGEMRVANAALYNQSAHNDAIRDDETSRTFFIPTYKERLAGQASIEIQGNRLEFGDDDIEIPLVFDDYFLFSLCEQIHYRMPTDFDADAAIVIRDPSLFQRRLTSAFNARFPGWLRAAGPVTYYDPYRDYSKFGIPEMAKHFGYAYQKEYRIAFRPPRKPATNLEPVFLSVGPMTEYADLICA